VGGTSVSWPVKRATPESSMTVDMRVQTMSSNSGRSGSMTKSSAPVMSTVRCPSLRCSRTRRMAAG